MLSDHIRPSWEEYFMKMAHLVAKRATCLRRKVGAVLVKDKRILATGYNGASRGSRHCLDLGCLREELKIPSGERHELCRAIHAEQNAIIQAALYGVSIKSATLFVTAQPCSICTKMLINAEIETIYYDSSYPDKFSMELLEGSNVKIFKYPFEGV